MTTIALEDHDLSLEDYSALELRLQGLGARLAPPGEVYTAPEGQQRARLASPIIEFNEAHTGAAEVELALSAYGLRQKSP